MLVALWWLGSTIGHFQRFVSAWGEVTMRGGGTTVFRAISSQASQGSRYAYLRYRRRPTEHVVGQGL